MLVPKFVVGRGKLAAAFAGILLVAVVAGIAWTITAPSELDGADSASTGPSTENVSSAAPAGPVPSEVASEGADLAWQTVLALASVLTALIAVATALYLYRWRRIILADHPNPLVPEEWGAHLHKQNDVVRALVQHVNLQTQNTSAHLERNADVIREMTETFMTFKNALDEKDREIERLRKGYDAHTYRKFLNRFIRLHQSLGDIRRDGDLSPKSFDFLSMLLEDALEECSVTIFEPEPGENFRLLGDRVADNPATVETDDPEKDFTIASVEVPGYEVSGAEREVVLVPARVSIFRHTGT